MFKRFTLGLLAIFVLVAIAWPIGSNMGVFVDPQVVLPEKYAEVGYWNTKMWHNKTVMGLCQRVEAVSPIDVVAFMWSQAFDDDTGELLHTTVRLAITLNEEEAQAILEQTDEETLDAVSAAGLQALIYSAFAPDGGEATMVQVLFVGKICTEPRSGNAVWQIGGSYWLHADDYYAYVTEIFDPETFPACFWMFFNAQIDENFMMLTQFFGMDIYLDDPDFVFVEGIEPPPPS